MEALIEELPLSEEKNKAYVVGGTSIVFEGGFNSLRFCRYGPMVYNQNDTYVGRSLDLYGEYNHAELELLAELVRPHTFVVEVGANIGSHTVPLAQRCGQLYAFEPQRLVYQALCANVALNQLTNVHAWQAAVGDCGGRVFMPELDPWKTHNFGGVSVQSNESSEAVMQIALDDINLPQCGLLKVDVEGMELEVLKGADKLIAKFRPYIYIENDRREKSEALIAHLQGLGYTLYWHLPPLFNEKNVARSSVNVFQNIVSVNMLCLPKVDMDSFGLRRIKGTNDSWN